MAIPSMITFQSLANSNMPAEQKSAIRRWYESSMGPGGGNTYALAKLHAKAGLEGVRSGGEAIVTGSILGTMHAMLPTGLDVKKVPMDAVLGVAGLAAGAVLAQEEIGPDARNVGAAALSIFAFRKTHDLVREVRIKRSGVGAGAAVNGIGNKIGKASFAGEEGMQGPGGLRYNVGQGQADIGAEDPVMRAARNL